MPLYTLIADYARGTYVAQHRASSPRAAAAKWVRESAECVHGNKKAAQTALQRGLAQGDNLPVPLAGLVGVWCMSATFRRRLLLLNIVETDGTPNQAGAGNGAVASSLQVGRQARAVPDQRRWADI